MTALHGQEVKQERFPGHPWDRRQKLASSSPKRVLFPNCFLKFPSSKCEMTRFQLSVNRWCHIWVLSSQARPGWAPGEVREGWERGGGKKGRPPGSSSQGNGALQIQLYSISCNEP